MGKTDKKVKRVLEQSLYVFLILAFAFIIALLCILYPAVTIRWVIGYVIFVAIIIWLGSRKYKQCPAEPQKQDNWPYKNTEDLMVDLAQSLKDIERDTVPINEPQFLE